MSKAIGILKPGALQTCENQYGSINVSISTLVKLLYRKGDIHFKYDSSTTSEEGRKTQKQVQSALLNNPAYQKEVSARFGWQNAQISIQVRGRADGLMLGSRKPLVEEYKTTRTDVDALHANTGEMHMAQLKLYAGIFAMQYSKYSSWNLALIYVNPDTLLETHKAQEFTTQQLSSFLEQTCVNFSRIILSHRRFLRQRNDSLRKLAFPYPSFRSKQKLLSANVFRNLRDKKHTLFEAPTGSGKTLATIFPTLKAIGHDHLDRMIFLTARNTGKLAVEGAIDLLAGTGAKVRSISLTAKHTICFQESVNCDPNLCKYAKGYYSRVDDAVDACLAHVQIHQKVIERTALEFEVCPFELSLDVSVWCDVVVCDYNYVFDPFVRFRRLAGIFDERAALLIDESHQLVDRVRGCLSVRFTSAHITNARKALDDNLISDRFLTDLIERLTRQIHALRIKARQTDDKNARGEREICVPVGLLSDASLLVDYISKDSMPSDLFSLEVQKLFYACMELVRKYEFLDKDNVYFFIEWDVSSTTLNLFCANPAAHIAESITTYPASLRFSGTLSPIGLYESLHGVPNSELWRVESPFTSEQLGVFVVGDISTNFRHRNTTKHKIAGAIFSVVSAKNGNYLVAFPSYEYLRQIFELFTLEFPQVRVQAQTSEMGTIEQVNFLNTFKTGSDAIVGFVVLGGIFTESIDFSGDELLGMIVVGMGLPPPNLRTLIIARAYAESQKSTLAQYAEFGRLVAFRYPAMSRVIQAAGRLIRSHNDHGVLCLIDPRYRQSDYRCFFPDNWCSCYVNSLELPVELERFWKNKQNRSERITG